MRSGSPTAAKSHAAFPGVFVVYCRNAESTASAKNAEGRVAAGDAGFIEDGSGHLRIIDRDKDVGKMADGCLSEPKYVENKLKFHPDIPEEVAFGTGREMCCAFLNIDLTAVGSWPNSATSPMARIRNLPGIRRLWK